MGGSKCQGTGCKVNTTSVFQPAASNSSQTTEKREIPVEATVEGEEHFSKGYTLPITAWAKE